MSLGAIASSMAGRTHGLKDHGPINDYDQNATKFWLLTAMRGRSKGISGNHVGMTINVSDTAGGLKKGVESVEAMGYIVRDMDSHLHPGSAAVRSFFLELKRTHGKNPYDLLKVLRADGINSNILGVYDDHSQLVIPDNPESVPAAIAHDEWEGRVGLDTPEGSTVIYVAQKGIDAPLSPLLKEMARVNINDMSRPTRPHGNDFERGYYFVLDPATEESQVSEIIAEIHCNKAYDVQRLDYKNGALQQ
jgi:prephenate dehydratase